MPVKPAPNLPELKPHSLSGGEKNEVLFVKSRTGHLVALDDGGCTVRVQDRTGNSTIRLEAGKIYITQKTGDIKIFARELVRLDCTDLEVHARNDISFSAGGSVTTTVKGSASITAGKDVALCAKQDATLQTKANFSATSGAQTLIVGTKQLSLGTKSANLTLMTSNKLKVVGKGNVSVNADAFLNITALGGADFKTNGMCEVRARATWAGMAGRININ
ncbi:MAG: hypothetical protein KatS3mg102_0466 [Planctomycetota bacterium]|nr:MAG: hypothetical protein KatS3mg102_0466 [Planctomycetota bacterium]